MAFCFIFSNQGLITLYCAILFLRLIIILKDNCKIISLKFSQWTTHKPNDKKKVCVYLFCPVGWDLYFFLTSSANIICHVWHTVAPLYFVLLWKKNNKRQYLKPSLKSMSMWQCIVNVNWESSTKLNNVKSGLYLDGIQAELPKLVDREAEIILQKKSSDKLLPYYCQESYMNIPI